MDLSDLKVQLGSNWKKVGMIALAVLALLAGVWWAWRAHKPPVVPTPAATQAQEAITTGAQAITEAQDAVKKGKAILKRIPGEVTQIEANAISAADRATLDQLADRANGRIREWVTTHSTGNAHPSGAGGSIRGAVVPGGGGPSE